MSKARLVTCLILLPLFTIAAQQIEETDLSSEPLEQYGDPPAPFPLRGTGVSPGIVSEYGPFTSHQVNVNSSGLNITGDAANEPSITVDPTNPNRMVIGWRQFDSVSSNFRTSGYGYTSDGGITWTFPGVLEPGVFRSDPVLIADDIGRFLYLSLLETFFDNVWRSVDSGHSWTNLGPATGGDKQWFAIDNNALSTGHGFQHQCWSTAGNNYNGRQYSRSTDGGVTWMDPINIPHSPIWGTPDVDSTGTLFIGGISGSTIYCIRSQNAKNGAVIPTFDQSTIVNLGGRIVQSVTINPGGLAGQIFLAADRSGTSTNNNVYMLASVQPTGFTTGTDVMFARSTNGGTTFSTAKRINDDPVNHNKWHWLGTIGVAPNGRLDSVWLDTRNAANNTDSQLFYSFSTDAGTTWSANTAVSQAFNPFLGYPNQNKMGDYITLVSDNTGANVAYCATFNLEEDIYHIRVFPPTVPTPTPSPSPSPIPSPTPSPAPTPTPAPTPSPSPTPSPAPTPTPIPTVNIAGNVDYCSNPALPPVPGVTMTLTGSASDSTLSDASGNYSFSSIVSGGSYTVTPSKTAFTPGSNGINTVDVVAVQRHFLSLGQIPPGCRLTAADVNGDASITTVDVIAIQRFFLGMSTGIANVGKYNFTPANRSYPGISGDQTGQNYDALVFGDVAAAFTQ